MNERKHLGYFKICNNVSAVNSLFFIVTWSNFYKNFFRSSGRINVLAHSQHCSSNEILSKSSDKTLNFSLVF